MPTYSYVLAAAGGGGGGGFAALAGLAHEPDHAGFGLARVLAEYVPAVRLRAILDILLDGVATIGGTTGPTGVQSPEDLAWQLYTERSLVTVEGGGPAVGEQLDVIGRVVGLGRLEAFGGSDDVYRAALTLKVLANRSNGQLDEVLELLALGATVAGSTDAVGAHEFYPAAFRTEMPGMGSFDLAEAVWIIAQAAKAAGVRWDFLYSLDAASALFTYSDDLAAPGTSATLGYGDLAMPPAAGGRLMGLLP